MLRIDNLHVSVGKKEILKGLNLKVNKDEIHVIMGPNGAGKSTICNAIMNNPDYTKTSGSCLFNGEDISTLTTDEIAKKGIFFLMQNPVEIPGVTNAEMLRLALSERNEKLSIFEFNKALNSTCEDLNIDKSFIHHNINERMSGGEKKKNELLQLYMLNPKLILLDELDSGLDVDALETLATSLLEYKKVSKCSILIITHHTNILKYITPSKVHILVDGKIVEEGDASLAEKIETYGFKGAYKSDMSDENA